VGLIYSAALLVVGTVIVATLPVGKNDRSGRGDRDEEVQGVPRASA